MRLHIRWVVAASAVLLVAARSPVQPESPSGAALPLWSERNVSFLREEAVKAPLEALPAPDLTPLDRAILSGTDGALDRAAFDLANKLAELHLLGAAKSSEKAGWNIADSDTKRDLRAELTAALTEGRLAEYFQSLRPRHPDYAALRSAYAAEGDADRKRIIARNLERWRWLPNDLGQDFVLVNAASFEASLWRSGARIDTWPVIVGKPKSPTPVFVAKINGVTFNPWWDIPENIVRESIGALVRKSPSLARQRGYVWGGGRYRQKPGPNNSLGQMKLVMPNRYSIYLHDTPSKDLFTREVRAFSHGCIRVGDALGFAKMLLGEAATNEAVDSIITSGKTTTIKLADPMPVYITYFTATVRGDGQFVVMPDLYARDTVMGDASNPVERCAA